MVGCLVIKFVVIYIGIIAVFGILDKESIEYLLFFLNMIK